MKFNATINPADLARVKRQFDALSGPQAREALGKALKDTAFHVRGAMVKHMEARFDRPTPFIARSPKVLPSRPGELSVEIAPTLYHDNRWSKGGKQGVDPQQVLQAQAAGGTRRDKKSEVVLRRAGLLPAGYQTVLPSDPYPGSTDAYGNISGTFIRSVLSYLQAFVAGMGYEANMKAKRRAKLEDRTLVTSLATRRTYRTIRGVAYFVSFGPLRTDKRGRTSPLPPGIWAKTGIHGVDVKPVLLFVKAGRYTPRLDFDQLAIDAGVEERLGRAVRYRIRQAAEALAR